MRRDVCSVYPDNYTDLLFADMKILSIELRPLQHGEAWSWGKTSGPIWDYIISQGHEVARTGFEGFFGQQAIDKLDNADVVLYQNTDLIKPAYFIPEKSVIRLGNLQSFNLTALKQAKAVIATNQVLYDSIKSINGNITVIPNGIDLDKWEYVQKLPELVVGFSAHASQKSKGLELVQEGVAKAGAVLKTAIYPDTFIPYGRMYDEFYRKIGILISASANEGCSNVIMEALACGVPVILTKTGYHGETLTDKLNCLFTQRNGNDIARCINLLKNDPKLCATLRKNGREYAERHHNHKVVASQYLKVFGAGDVKEERKPVLNWQSGTQGYAHNNKVNRLIKCMPEFQHTQNVKQQNPDEVIISVSPFQIKESWLTDKKWVISQLCSPREFLPEWEGQKNTVINWACGGHDWAYKHIAAMMSKVLPYPTQIDRNGTINVFFAPSPYMTRDLHRAICRLDGCRVYDDKFNITGVMFKEGLMYEKELSQCGALIATNKKLYEFGKSVNPETYFITNGIILDEFPYVYKIKPARCGFTVGFVGNITKPSYREYKGYDYVVGACEKENAMLKEALYKDKQIPHAEMTDKFYSQIDCLIHPTLGEGCSNAIMEALSCGIPVITTKTAGYHGEMLEDGENVLFVERDIDSIAEAVRKLKQSHRLRLKLSHNGRAFAEDNHDITKLAKQWNIVIEAIIQRNKNVI